MAEKEKHTLTKSLMSHRVVLPRPTGLAKAGEWTEAFLGACLNYEILDPSADGTALNTANIAVQGLTDYLQWECNGAIYTWQPTGEYWFCNANYPLYDPNYIFSYYLPGLP